MAETINGDAQQRAGSVARRATVTVATPPTPAAKILRFSDWMDDCKRRIAAAERKYLQAEQAIETADWRATVAWNKYLKVKLEYETAKSPIAKLCHSAPSGGAIDPSR